MWGLDANRFDPLELVSCLLCTECAASVRFLALPLNLTPHTSHPETVATVTTFATASWSIATRKTQERPNATLISCRVAHSLTWTWSMRLPPGRIIRLPRLLTWKQSIRSRTFLPDRTMIILPLHSLTWKWGIRLVLPRDLMLLRQTPPETQLAAQATATGL